MKLAPSSFLLLVAMVSNLLVMANLVAVPWSRVHPPNDLPHCTGATGDRAEVRHRLDVLVQALANPRSYQDVLKKDFTEPH